MRRNALSRIRTVRWSKLNEMDPLDWTQSFVEHCERSPAPELAAIFQRALEHMGFRHFACCSHVNSRSPPQGAVVLHNYPSAWVRSYADRELHRDDPVFQRAERDILPFRWNTPEFQAALTAPQRSILQEAATNGIVNGYTVPIHLPRAAGALRASCSVIPDSNLIENRAYCAVQVMATYLYGTVAINMPRRKRESVRVRCSVHENANVWSSLRRARATGRSVSCSASANTRCTSMWKPPSAT